jgi:putative ABC transport system permease protein
VTDRGFVLRMAGREARASRRQIGLYAGAISLGVAALVAITSFRADVTAALEAESRGLLGADVELHSRAPLDTAVTADLDSLRDAGARVALMTSFSSMAYAPRTGATRLVEVRAAGRGYPFYGTIETDPPDRWTALQAGRQALVDPAVLVYLGLEVGDSLRLGDATFTVVGTLSRVPGEIGLRAAIGPRIYIGIDDLPATNLLRLGSLARYSALIALPNPADAEPFVQRYRRSSGTSRVAAETASHRERDLKEWFDALSRFLALLGLTALLLGGLATGSAIHVYVKRKLPTVAVLRCLGATLRRVFAVYLLQAVLMGLAGAAVGVVVGVAVQRALPAVLADFLPLEVVPRLRPLAIVAGLGIGVWIALAFGLIPLLDVRTVSPLQALRRDVEAQPHRRDRWAVGAKLLLAATVVVLSVSQAPVPAAGFAFAGAIGAAALALWLTARGGMALARRFFPRRTPYVVRQGIANLFRPHNQTIPVVLAVGFGVFLLGTLRLVQENLLDQFAIETEGPRPNLVVFDIQPDQGEGVLGLLAQASSMPPETTPIVPGRIAAIGGRPVDSLMADTTGPRPSRWALRREYRNTYRDSLVGSETLVAGHWWPDAPLVPPGVARIAIEQDLAAELQVGVGDRITWDVQGVRIESEIVAVRSVDWARFEPNFFVVFEPGILEAAPQTLVTLAQIAGPRRLAEVQRDLVRRFPNVSALDVSIIQDALQRLLGSVSLAIQFMGLFSIGCGIVVLFGAVATSRLQRLRESVLLRTIGARTPQIRGILAAEYVALGLLASGSGALLAVAGGWGAVTFLFDLDFRLPLLTVLGLVLIGAAVTTAIGLVGNRALVQRPPLAVLRELGE